LNVSSDEISSHNHRTSIVVDFCMFHPSWLIEKYSEDIFFMMHRGKSEHISALAKDKPIIPAPKISH